VKLMWVGNWHESSGYSSASRAYLLALDAAGVQVVPRRLTMTGRAGEIPGRILELEAQSAAGCDVVVQHTLPSHAVYDGHFALNACLFAAETSHFRASGWAKRLNLLDLAIVPSRAGVATCRNSGVAVPVEVVPHACDPARYLRSWEPHRLLEPYRREGRFIFYTVADFNRRKNLAGLLKAYFREFSPTEGVILAVKTSAPAEHCNEFAREIARGTKIRGGDLGRQPPVLFVGEAFSDDDVMRWHAGGDTFVSAAFAEGWGLGGHDAMAMGKTPVLSATGGHLDYCDDEVGWLVKTHPAPCFGMNNSVEDLYCGDEDWDEVLCGDLCKAMREAFSDEGLRSRKAARGLTQALRYSLENVGQTFKGVIERHVKELAPA
jgi:glycosyltransferase involved in cell wall biosynthesis